MTKSSSPKVSSRKARTAKPTSKRTRKTRLPPRLSLKRCVVRTARPLGKSPPRRSAIHGTPRFSNNFPARKYRTHSASLPKGTWLIRASCMRDRRILSKPYWRAGRNHSARLVRVPRRLIVGSSTLLSATSIPASTLRRASLARETSAEVMELQAAYWRKLFGEFRPIREHAHCHPKPAFRAEIGNSFVQEMRGIDTGPSAPPPGPISAWGKYTAVSVSRQRHKGRAKLQT